MAQVFGDKKLVTLSQLSLNKFCIFEKLLNKWILQETFQQFAKMDGQNRVHRILADQWPFACPPTFTSISILGHLEIFLSSKKIPLGNISKQAEKAISLLCFQVIHWVSKWSIEFPTWWWYFVVTTPNFWPIRMQKIKLKAFLSWNSVQSSRYNHSHCQK